MDLVVTYLKDVKRYVIVPENYIYGFNLKSLKNLGNNSCRDQLVFWSDECIEGLYYPEPNANANKLRYFPPGIDGGWYHGRTIYFTGMHTHFVLFNNFIIHIKNVSITDDFEEAKRIKERRRNFVPPVYNPRRLSEQPIPLLVLVPNAEENVENVEQRTENDPLGSSIEHVNSSSLSNNDTNEADAMDESVQNGEVSNSDLYDDQDEAIDSSGIHDETEQSNSTALSNDGQFGTATDSSAGKVATISPVVVARNNESNSEVETVKTVQSGETSYFDSSASSSDAQFEANIDSTTTTMPSTAENATNDESNNEGVSFERAQSNDVSTSESSDNQLEPVDESCVVSNIAPAVDASAVAIANEVKVEPVFAPLCEKDAQAIEKVLNDSYEQVNESDDDVLICIQETIPMPMAMKNPYQVKSNDILSGNMPFATHVRNFEFNQIFSTKQSFICCKENCCNKTLQFIIFQFSLFFFGRMATDHTSHHGTENG